ncbi:MAG: sterol desaturase family protein [Bdellovibrionales bacterium]|nr:sterol desaturase family protein [Bdellovibrionales bacterium]
MNESALRLGFFIGGLVVFTIMGYFFPRRKWQKPRFMIFLHNLILGAVNPLLIRLIFGSSLVALSHYLQENSVGLLNNFTLPLWGEVIVVVLFLDFVIYWQHRLFHQIPWLWRLHRVHHTDTEFDPSTALRFHFVEAILSYVVKAVALLIVGGPMLGVIVFEIILNFSAMFNHSNWRVFAGLDQWLRKLIVTPDFHRIHHSIYPKETNSNYGFFMSVWDYIFRSYVSEPRDGQETMSIGLKEFREDSEQNCLSLWVQPLK